MTRKPVVKVTTLGRFCVHVRGEPLAFGRKMPLRPLALLKYLAANGGEIADGKSKNSVRSFSVASEMSLPRVSGATRAYTCSRFVVLPPRPGP